jgi:hypothetical protein
MPRSQARTGSDNFSKPKFRNSIREETAGEGNRTLVSSLEGYSSTIELHPRAPSKLTRLAVAAKFFLVRGEFSFTLPFPGTRSS